jgi:hypothetical protein
MGDLVGIFLVNARERQMGETHCLLGQSEAAMSLPQNRTL